jgi:hypothetical protein
MGVDSTIVEKDFWVCWMLRQTFALPDGHAPMFFKGGTSLAKAYNLIQRFSEDIDLVTAVNFYFRQGIADPAEDDLSKSERLRRMEALDIACARYVAGDLMGVLQKACVERLRGDDDWGLSIDSADRYAHTLLFRYPVSSSKSGQTYIRGRVKIELGWHSATVPQEQRICTPYIAERFPNIMGAPNVTCTVLSPIRTFWEKVTVLHAANFRDEVPHFFSRRYSNVAALYQAYVAELPSLDLEMLEGVRRYKQRYYPSAWAHYELAQPGSIVIVPGVSKLRALETDYRDMRMMFFQDPPEFGEVLQQLTALQERLNIGS